jgi:DNA repair exonuclease SbcCD ATPase subunit
MARGGINKALVHAARNALLGRGLHPSIDLVRVELGNTGSKSTIQRYLKELNSVTDKPLPPAVDEEILSFVASLAQRLTQNAQSAVEEERGQLDRQQLNYAQERSQLRERLEQSLATITHLRSDLEQQHQCERELREQLKDTEGDRQGLRQVVAGQQQLLEERATQLQSLEEKHQHAREALEHYRQEHLAQRGQELRRHDEQIQQLRQELRTLQNAQLVKQEELLAVYRDHERLLNENRAHLEQLRQQAKSVHDSQLANDTLTARVQQLLTEQAMLRERVKPYLFRHREDRRRLRDQARQLETLQTLLHQVPPTA